MRCSRRMRCRMTLLWFFFFQAEDGIRDTSVTGVQTCALPIFRDLICSAPRTPVRMQEQVSNVMATQWLRGSEWAISHARGFRDEVKARVESGIAEIGRASCRERV